MHSVYCIHTVCSHDVLGKGFKPTGYSQQPWEVDIVTLVFTRRKQRHHEFKKLVECNYAGS